jgi:hypothetical protein
MTNRAQFEAMLEALINDDQAQAEEIFHNIVVGKSREIYEELLESDFSKDQGNPYGKADDEEEPEDGEDNPFADEDDAEGDDAEGDDAEGDDAEGDDAEGDDAEGEEDGDEGLEDRVMDLEDALEDLKAEFEQLMSDEEHEPEHHDGIDDPEFGSDDMGQEEDPSMMMEYVNKVTSPKHGDNGTNTKSTIDNMKNDMGGTTANIAQSFSTTTGGTKGGLAAPTAKVEDFGNVNKPGANAGKTAFKKSEPGHGAEKKGAAPGGNVGAETGKNSRDGEKNTTSVISKRVR